MTVLGALVSVPANLGYPVLALFVGAESAGALVPGETALIVAGALAGSGRLSLPIVIAVAAGAAILGDNIGYLIGRRGLRLALARGGATRRRRLLEETESFFKRYGSAAVFFGRWLPGARVFTAWFAGADRMPWPKFGFWNALGGITWATTIGTAAYFLGRSASGSLGLIGFAGLAIAALVFIVSRIRKRRKSRGSDDDSRPGERETAANTKEDGMTILFAYDGSEGADAAIAAGAKLVAHDGADAIVLTVWEPLVVQAIRAARLGGGVAVPLDVGAEDEESKRQAELLAEHGAEVAAQAGMKAGTRAIADNERGIAESIVAAADDADAGLIVLGARGLAGVRAFLGSVSNRVLQQSHRPVLVVPPAKESG